MNLLKNSKVLYLLAVILGVLSGIYANHSLLFFAQKTAKLFITTLQWGSLPLIFFSILVTILKVRNARSILHLTKSIMLHSVVTTFIAAAVGASLFFLIKPNKAFLTAEQLNISANGTPFGMLLISSVILSATTAFFVINSSKSRILTEKSFAYYESVLKIAKVVISTLPIALWAFIVMIVSEIKELNWINFGDYLACVIGANIIQAAVILPLMLKTKGICVKKLFKSVWPGLQVAFFSRSSSVALPQIMHLSINNARIPADVARVSLPLCTTINMNACAAFIAITLFFVSTNYGVQFSFTTIVLTTVAATLGAIINAGVPMGCFTITLAILSYNQVPSEIMGLILPWYALIDMFESAINVWSNVCVTSMVAANTHVPAQNRAIAS